MQRQAWGAAADVGIKGDLRFDDLQKIFTLTFREYLEARLARCLKEQVITLPRYGEKECRRDLIATDKSVVNFRVDRYLSVLLRRLRQGDDGIKQMHGDVVHSRSRSGVG